MAAVDDWRSYDRNPRALFDLTPEPLRAYEVMNRLVWGEELSQWKVDLELSRRRMAVLMRSSVEADRLPPCAPEVAEPLLRDLAQWPTSPAFDPAARAALGVAERFVLDVSATTPSERSQLFDQIGAQSFSFVQALYVLDMTHRIRIATGRLFGVDQALNRYEADGITEPSSVDGVEKQDSGDLWQVIESFMRVVARQDALDPVTTELVRLAGARQHGCRLCRTRRSAAALSASDDATLFDQALVGVSSDFDFRQRAAIRLTDAMTSQPSEIDDELAEAVRSSFTPVEVSELVWDVARNGTNKIAVFFGADEPTVSEGVEIFEIDANGDVSVG
ncbi:MAG TPA: hypothetical protein VEJ87_05570 [Acidimicrobiales bacterium]|nr:hypothetical protein [Acidimicrobiales bacterium]